MAQQIKITQTSNADMNIGVTRTQTAVEWLIGWIGNNQYFIGDDLLQAFEQAKAMEKEQMKGMYVEGGFAQMRYFDGKEFITGEQYYNEKYNK